MPADADAEPPARRPVGVRADPRLGAAAGVAAIDPEELHAMPVDEARRILPLADDRLLHVGSRLVLAHARVLGRGRAAAAGEREEGDHCPTGPPQPATRRSGGASAWQIATASASAAWLGVGGASSPRIAFTIRCTSAFSAPP